MVLSPDVSFVSQARLKKIRVAPDKFLAGAPDLAVEVLYPPERMIEIHRKLEHYFEHGTRLAWLVNLRKQQIHIYTADSIEALTDMEDAVTAARCCLVSNASCEGSSCRVDVLFRSLS